MNILKKNGGFTLVELIVVIAILAILAGVAVPAYSGYIEKAKDAAIITELDAIQTAAQAANATKGAIKSIVVNGTTIVVEGTNGLSDTFEKDFALFYKGTADGTNDGTITLAVTLTDSSYKNGATWYGDGATIPTGKAAGWNAN